MFIFYIVELNSLFVTYPDKSTSVYIFPISSQT
nr:MAG TPA: hypothetical protein [Bacteriophage sp.]